MVTGPKLNALAPGVSFLALISTVFVLMHLALLGATGRTGRPLLDQALAAGHTVTALARTSSALAERPGLTVVAGDALDPDAVASVVDGADAVLLTLGPTSGAPPDTMRRAAENVVAAMRQHGVRRVVTETGAGVPDPKDPGGLGPTLMRGVMRLVVPKLLSDSQAHVDAFPQSGLDWTAVRAPRLTNGERTGEAKVGYFSMGPGHSVSRADVAEVMLRLATSGDYAGQAPMVTG